MEILLKYTSDLRLVGEVFMKSGMYNIKQLDHLGLVAGMCKELGIAEFIDNLMPNQSSNKHISYGETVVAMILNGLGFTARTLHMFPEYHSNKPLDTLIRSGIKSEHVNDKVLGRTLDKLYQLGVSDIYSALAQKVVKKLKLPCKSAHLDTTSFHVDGEYKSNTTEETADEEEDRCIKICHGYSRDHRPDLNKLCKTNFLCKQDAKKAFDTWIKSAKYGKAEMTISQKASYKQAGRPKKNSPADGNSYFINADPFIELSTREEKERALGYFILATNDCDTVNFTASDVLENYKSQQQVERGFRFLKDPAFLVSSLFLKKPERIEAMLMIMTLCLMIYAAIQHRIRYELKKQSKCFPDMKRKAGQNPTARWVFFCFQGVNVLHVGTQERHITGLQERQLTIINILGHPYQEIYS